MYIHMQELALCIDAQPRDDARNPSRFVYNSLHNDNINDNNNHAYVYIYIYIYIYTCNMY